MRKTLDQLNTEYGFKAEDFVVDGKEVQPAAFKKWLKAAWEIDNVYALVQAEECSLGKAWELVTAIIEKHSLPLVREAILTVIPPMTDPLGKYWSQPQPEFIRIDDQYAFMTKNTFSILKSYNTSTPTGVYVGKMWKRLHGEYFELCWWGKHDTPNHCPFNCREIQLID